METLCCSFWFWFTMSVLVCVSVGAAFFSGLFLGREEGKKEERADIDMKIGSMLRRLNPEGRG
jgi:hypothetical protein